LWAFPFGEIFPRHVDYVLKMIFCLGYIRTGFCITQSEDTRLDKARSEWSSVVGAIESALPIYESTSEWISLGLAGPLRRRAVAFLRSHRREWVLDSGAGPGVSSRMLLRDGFENIVGLDPSIQLLRFARSRLGDKFCPIVGVAENLPFRQGSLGGVITCFALRDVVNLDRTLDEFARATRRGGALAVVDIGKPDGAFWRVVIGFYISQAMPVLAHFSIRGRTPGNPFKMIIPTWRKLKTNRRLSDLIEASFGPCALKSFFFGGLVVFEADRFSVWKDVVQ
jgi:ubiquinone/menaquinone biosynthesis C-methylase UbiE